ncbi:DNA-binding protein [Perilla frutescens var. hirtella]|nr:DNA-binding protein [Perilla frutescens var. hirtella]
MVRTWLIVSPTVRRLPTTSLRRSSTAATDRSFPRDLAPRKFQINASEMGKKNVNESQRYKDAMDALLKPVSSYTLLYESPPPLVPTSKTPRKKKVKSKSTPDALHQISPNKTDSFFGNVVSLTSTGMLDGAPVSYLSASREKELRGIIKGASYVCGCEKCNYSKELTANEFEIHAGCKTGHANDHIHLGNGKSLHKVAKELKNTPSATLCVAVQTLLGDSLNQEAFDSWKESFEAARKTT